MSPRFARYAYLISLLCLVLSGCADKPKKTIIHTGPTLPLDQIVTRINENNRYLPSLFARHSLEANIVHKGKTRFVNAEGDLFVHKPRELYLRANKGALAKVFEMGSTAETFWFSEYVDENVKWWGHHKNVGKPCSQEMPIRPDLFGEVLGINDLAPDLLEAPVPTLQYNNDVDVYMISWHARSTDRWVTEKQVFYDRATLLPRKVLLFDRNGRVVLRANLSAHQAVEIDGKPQNEWPKVATAYDLLFPDTGSSMNVRLSDMVVKNKAGHPNESTIPAIAARQDQEVTKEIQIDADCE